MKDATDEHRPRQSRDAVGGLLLRLCRGDEHAFNELLPLVYTELQLRARVRLRHEATRYGFDPTELVHETYLRLVQQRHKCWDNRAHFLAVSAIAMRRVLFDYVRRYRRRKRGNDVVLAVDPELLTAGVTVEGFVCLDRTLSKLAHENSRAARVVELKVFGGLKIDEIAKVLHVSVVTVKRDWTQARQWLRDELQ